MPVAQEGRSLKITTPLGADTLVLRSVRVQEALSRPYLIQAEMIGDSDAHKPADLIGKVIGITVVSSDMTREFSGVVRNFGKVGQLDAEMSVYRLEAVPKWWLLSRTADCRAWQNKSAKDIVTELTGEGGATPVRWGGSVPTTVRPYVIQYNESDMDFCQRMLDEVGAAYWFDQTLSSHEMVVAGANAEYPLHGTDLVVRGEDEFKDGVTAWSLRSEHPPAKVMSHDFDLITPSSSPIIKQSSSVLPTKGAESFEMFLWPGGSHGHPDIDPAKLFMEQLEAGSIVATCTTKDPRIHAGSRVKVAPKLGSATETWLVTEVVHAGYDETQLSGDGTFHYAAQLTLIPADRTFRVSNPRPRPHVPGLQSAIVVGTGEIDTDDKGRVLVRFLWDRKKQYQGGTSIRVRMVHPYAGAWGGAFFLPRIGDEVLVGFVDGDPDKPVIVGTLFNADGPPPWPLPGNKTVAGFLSRSTEGGMAGDGFVSPTAADALTSDHTKKANIIRFNDKIGSEEVYLQAQKDQLQNVKNDRKEYVGHDHLEEIKNDRTITVRKGNDVFLVDTGTQTTTIEGNHTTTIRTGNQANTVKTGNQDNLVETGNQTNVVKTGTQTTTVKGDQSVTVQSGDQTIKVESGKQTMEVKGDTALKVTTGNRTVKVDSASYTLEAAVKITLKVGSNSIEISQSGIEIKGIQFTVKADGMGTVDGGGMLTVKGGIVKIN
ncbi:type VI secretion system Vgr family protein [Plastoroseomonas arctica]|uniref:Type VI secretion system tip protein VgrG n=1 Tax=Plastoroseomonas arctica TaxID=1509237 RepID=A0AAF1KUK0_9PROT|nr:type VI secretion system tip protein TssI/VgrG [Plastoroseomonas arctica]MBR0656292.1 type VI secretion system tip protein VgrG [Plastoroseomonas arctica]